MLPKAFETTPGRVLEAFDSFVQEYLLVETLHLDGSPRKRFARDLNFLETNWFTLPLRLPAYNNMFDEQFYDEEQQPSITLWMHLSQ